MLSQTMVSRTASVHAKAAVVRPTPVASHALTGQIELMGATMPFVRNAEIYGENEKSEYLYKVLSGSVRTYKILNDGRRQIGSFYMPGDLFGLEVGEMHAFPLKLLLTAKFW